MTARLCKGCLDNTIWLPWYQYWCLDSIIVAWTTQYGRLDSIIGDWTTRYGCLDSIIVAWTTRYLCLDSIIGAWTAALTLSACSLRFTILEQETFTAPAMCKSLNSRNERVSIIRTWEKWTILNYVTKGIN